MLLYIGIAATIAVVVLAIIYFRGENEGVPLAIFLGIAFGGVYSIVMVLVAIPFQGNYTDSQSETTPLTSFSEYAGTGEGGKLVTVDSAEETVTFVVDDRFSQITLDKAEFYDSPEATVETVQSEARHWWFAPFSIGSKTEFNFYVPSDTVDFTVQK